MDNVSAAESLFTRPGGYSPCETLAESGRYMHKPMEPADLPVWRNLAPILDVGGPSPCDCDVLECQYGTGGKNHGCVCAIRVRGNS